MRKIVPVIVFVACALPAVLYAASPNMKEGKWEITTTVEIPQPAGIPFKIPPITASTNHCYTKEEIAKSMAPDSSNKERECKVTEQKVQGNNVTWKTVCTGKKPATGTGEITLEGDSYRGWMKMVDKSGESTVTYKAKRIGDCQ